MYTFDVLCTWTEHVAGTSNTRHSLHVRPLHTLLHLFHLLWRLTILHQHSLFKTTQSVNTSHFLSYLQDLPSGFLRTITPKNCDFSAQFVSAYGMILWPFQDARKDHMQSEAILGFSVCSTRTFWSTNSTQFSLKCITPPSEAENNW